MCNKTNENNSTLCKCCGINPETKNHLCPYDLEILDLETSCNCCEECEDLCNMEI